MSHTLQKSNTLHTRKKKINYSHSSGLNLTTFKQIEYKSLTLWSHSLQVERELTYEKLAEWTKSASMIKAEVDLYLPKLKLEENYDLKSTLSSMGIRNAFDSTQADFTGMSAKKDLFISKIIHKAFVEVSEEGTEAAAATGVLVLRSKAPIVTFKADHPFLFFIKHNKSQTILFFGRLCSP